MAHSLSQLVGKCLLALMFSWPPRGALLCRHQLSSSSPLPFHRGRSHLACSGIPNSSLTLSPITVSKMNPTLPTKIPAYLSFSYLLCIFRVNTWEAKLLRSFQISFLSENFIYFWKKNPKSQDLLKCFLELQQTNSTANWVRICSHHLWEVRDVWHCWLHNKGSFELFTTAELTNHLGVKLQHSSKYRN